MGGGLGAHGGIRRAATIVWPDGSETVEHLTEAQRDGRACIHCASLTLAAAPVGHINGAGPVYACTPTCDTTSEVVQNSSPAVGAACVQPASPGGRTPGGRTPDGRTPDATDTPEGVWRFDDATQTRVQAKLDQARAHLRDADAAWDRLEQVKAERLERERSAVERRTSSEQTAGLGDLGAHELKVAALKVLKDLAQLVDRAVRVADALLQRVEVRLLNSHLASLSGLRSTRTVDREDLS